MSAIKIDPEIMHGTPCFNGTRVPVKHLFEWLAAGHTTDYFLEQFPTVSRQQVDEVLVAASEQVVRIAEVVPA